MIDLKVKSSCNFPNATTLPIKVTNPINTAKIPAKDSAKFNVIPSKDSNIAALAINADAPPPKPLKIATSCGIAVIFIFKANIEPISVPIIIPTIIVE